MSYLTKRKLSKQANLLMIVDVQSSHYIATKTNALKVHTAFSWTFFKQNIFQTSSAMNKYYDRSVTIKTLSEKEKKRKLHSGQYQVKVTFMHSIIADFESKLRPVDVQYRRNEAKAYNDKR